VLPVTGSEDVNHIAKAIFAERERCASIVESKMYDFGCIAGTDAADFVVVCADLSVDIRKPSKGVWRTDMPPQDGTPIYKRVIQPYRFLPYKPNSQQFKRGEKGRWQMMNEYGGWDNCPHPIGNEWSLESPFSGGAS
jgi:hypothetical protein